MIVRDMQQARTDGERPSIRVLLAIGDAGRERQLSAALQREGLALAGRCLDAPSLIERAAGLDADVALASTDLHRLTPATLLDVRESGLPLILLIKADELEKYAGRARVLPVGTLDEEIVAALREAASRGVDYQVAADVEGVKRSAGEDAEVAPTGQVLAIASGKGAPGKTTLAIALSAALGQLGRRVVLVDADLRGGNVAAYLDLDPRPGLLGLSGQRNGDKAGEGVEDELQEGPGFLVLAGIERPDLHSRITAELWPHAVEALRPHFDNVVVDAGQLVSPLGSGAVEGSLRSAGRILLASGADLVSLWNTRSAVRYATEVLGISRGSLGIVLNRRDGREEYGPDEVSRALDVPVLAALPEDRRWARRATPTGRQAMAGQQIASGNARVAREVRALASRLVGAPVERRKRRPNLPWLRFAFGWKATR